MSTPTGVLIFSHDISYAFTKTTEALANACTQLGIPAIVRDSCDTRLTEMVIHEVTDPNISLKIENNIGKHWDKIINDFNINCVLSLDCGWFVLPDHLQDHPSIKKIYSIWFDDFWSWTKAPTNAIFPYRKRTFQQNISDPKITHCFYGTGIANEAALMGFHNQTASKLAAPKEFLSYNYPCEITNKIAFIGNPGYRGEPLDMTIKMMDRGADLIELREHSREHILVSLGDSSWKWKDLHPDIKTMVAYATEVRVQYPYESALHILQLCGQKYPEALHALNKSGYILDVAWLIKLVTRYDRPALVRRLYKAGLVDVISNPLEWKPYGIEASNSVFADEMPKYYMKYLAHINAANATRDATANEKLFEISACARTSINLDSPDVRACYGENEIFLVNTLDEAEAVAKKLIENPDLALTMGKRARRRTALEHTWEHRLKNLFSLFPS